MTDESKSSDQILEVALSLPAAQRGEFLDRACHGAPVLRHMIERLMEEQGIPSSFLGTPALGEPEDISSNVTVPLPEPREEAPRFASGDLIAGRFRVARFIARGGMGEVYEVHDQFLQGTAIALKIVRPHIAADPYSSRRFEQEVVLARRANHRTLCPIYDIFRCIEPAPPFLFLTMKLLSGESLESRLRRSPPIPLDLGLQICDQLIEGIEAIHSVGIIHRDIKPNNVMLEQRGSEVFVTIMDFGLARLSEADTTIARDGLVAGTPGYLAPELIRGASPSQASDLYALGIVIHQILTGTRPAISKSGRIAVNPSSTDLSKAPPALAGAIAELLSDDPERRCTAFEQLTHRDEASPAIVKSPLLTRRSFAIGGTAVLCLLGGEAYWKRLEISNLLHPLPKKRFVALLNWPPPADAKIAPMLLGLIDTMVNALSRAEAFDHNFFVACQTSLTEMKTPAQVNDVCESLGANLILATSGFTTAQGVSLTLQVLLAGSSKVLRSRTLHVSTADQFSLPKMATHAAAQLLDIASVPENASLNQAGTDNPEALAAFQAAEALMKEPNNSGLDAAIEKFKLAVELDPHFANSHARLATAYFRAFAEHRDPASLMLARGNAETALNLDSASVEGHSALAAVYEETGNLPQAVRELAKALAPDPSNSRIVIYQAQLYSSLNRWQDAEDSLKRVLKSRPNYWLAYHELGNNYSYQGKYRLALQAFQAASMTAPRNALAVANMASMFFLLGNLHEAEIYVAKSLALATLPLTLQVRADIMRARNRFAESVQAALAAIEIAPEDCGAWLRLGDAYTRMNRHEKDAMKAYQRAKVSIDDILHISPNDGRAWMLMAICQCKLGNNASAKESIVEADSYNAVDIYSLVSKVRVLQLLGRKDDALATLATCLRMGATPTQISSTNDLELLLSDPRYPDMLKSTRAHLT